jgi:CRISPR-associated endonuclease/helicase Cas3
MNLKEFRTIFTNLTGDREPFPWQEALFLRLAEGRIPVCCDLPTGLGKTSVVALWLIALAAHPERVPRRLVYVVNRRTVVDQTTVEVEKLRKNLAAARLEERLKKLCATVSDVPLAISTLRGQFADNREWSADPSRPAVIVGTVDMIGSRLLFSGYGAGFKTMPLFAGFLGQDVLLVHDEAHLEPAFQHLLDAIKKEQKESGDERKIQVMQLSATMRGRGDENDLFQLTPADEEHAEVKRRLQAVKKLRLLENKDSKKLAEELAVLALNHQKSGRAVLVFARTVDNVEKIVAALQKEKQQVETLTGTLRGKERDALVEKPIFRRFFPLSPEEAAKVHEKVSGTVYLVCTSAGEVGVNISADHLICDLSTFESMAQRFGRVNRFGLSHDTQIDVIHPAPFDEKDPLKEPRELTLALLRQLQGDASPEALRDLDLASRLAAFSPPPTILPATDILFDAWSLTSIRDKLPGRPHVEPYLHGISDYEPPQTQVAWRDEVEVITGELLLFYQPGDFLEDYPLKPHELLKDRSDRILERLEELAELEPENRQLHVWLIDDEAIDIYELGDLVDKSKKEKAIIDDCIVLLPPALGGLSGGMLSGKAAKANDIDYDVSGEWRDENGKPRRERVWNQDCPTDPKMRRIRKIDLNPSPNEDEPDELAEKRVWFWYETPCSADTEGSDSARKDVLLDVHTSDVEGHMQRFVDKINLVPELKQALLLAAKLHDPGKGRKIWQQSIGNFNGTALAKSKKGMNWQLLGAYRHEFGSLLDATQNAEFQKLPEDMKDVVLHLIAAHHGRGRPHFSTEEAFDPEGQGTDVQAMALEVPRRFARLQQRYGRWGLAWLESLLRAADYAASAAPSETVKETP